jgi:hypothetical protein
MLFMLDDLYKWPQTLFKWGTDRAAHTHNNKFGGKGCKFAPFHHFFMTLSYVIF